MAPASKIIDVNPKRIDWHIKVRCIAKWMVLETEWGGKSLQFVFIDSAGDRIQTSVSSNLIRRFDDLIEEQNLYTLRTFSVKDNAKTYPITGHKYKLIFCEKTSVLSHIDRSFPSTIYTFRDFTEIKSSTHFDKVPLFDVIGRMVDKPGDKPRFRETTSGKRLEMH